MSWRCGASARGLVLVEQDLCSQVHVYVVFCNINHDHPETSAPGAFTQLRYCDLLTYHATDLQLPEFIVLRSKAKISRQTSDIGTHTSSPCSHALTAGSLGGCTSTVGWGLLLTSTPLSKEGTQIRALLQ